VSYGHATQKQTHFGVRPVEHEQYNGFAVYHRRKLVALLPTRSAAMDYAQAQGRGFDVATVVVEVLIKFPNQQS
jgi:hypothetical protein